MKYLKQSIGVLVNLDEIHLRHAFLTEEKQVEIKKSKRFSNTANEFWETHIWIENQIGKHPEVPTIVILEAANKYHQPIIHFLSEQGYSVYVVLPKTPPKAKATSSTRVKKAEIKTLAEKGLNGILTKWDVPQESQRALKELSNELIHRKKELLRANKKLKAKQKLRETMPNMVDRLNSYNAFLSEQIVEINRDFNDLIVQDSQLNGPITSISESYGLNPITLATMISESDGYVSI